MKKFITINGDKAWVSERETLELARQSAINISDHSKEIIVREVDSFTDYSMVYEEKTILSKIEMYEVMDLYKLSFSEANDHGYGFIGGLFNHKDENLVGIFDECFYVRSHTFPLNTKILLLIKSLQFWNRKQ